MKKKLNIQTPKKVIAFLETADKKQLDEFNEFLKQTHKSMK